MNTPLSNEENEKDKVEFYDFPRNNKKIIKYVIYCLVAIIILVLLFLVLTNINKDSKEYTSYYEKANSFKGNFAKLKKNERSNIFGKIGFSNINNSSGKLEDKTYEVSFAYNNRYDDLTQPDSIETFYNEKNEIVYIILNLVYKKEDFIVTNVVDDCNSILNNLISYSVKYNDIKKVLNDEQYYFDNSLLEVNYKLINSKNILIEQNNKDLKYYILNIDIKRK